MVGDGARGYEVGFDEVAYRLHASLQLRQDVVELRLWWQGTTQQLTLNTAAAQAVYAAPPDGINRT